MRMIKLPSRDEYIDVECIVRFQIAPPNAEHDKLWRVFINYAVGQEAKLAWVIFKTKKSAQNFCATLRKEIEAT